MKNKKATATVKELFRSPEVELDIKRNRRRRIFFLFYMTLPGLVVYTIFRFIPTVLGLVLSFFNWRGTSLQMTYIGFGNYTTLLNDWIFWRSLGNHLYIFLINTVVVFTLAILLAVLLSSKRLWERGFYRVLFFFPSVVPVVIINILWMSVLNPNIGLLNSVLRMIGLEGENWLGDRAVVKNTIIFVMAWTSLGFYMVLFMAAILNIPSSIFESARIDGAGSIRQTFMITIPLIWEHVRMSLLFFIVTSSGLGFNIIFMMSKGGPNRASEILTTFMYGVSFGGESRYGYGSAIAFSILIITSLIAMLIMAVTKREVYEY
ncbi:MAG: sugar ABC transporter permease [Clostridiaceae bacterium]|nr:sugar ABC transporter permease [Clostridiaceae bacterium]